MAKNCQLSPYLSVKYPTSHANTRFGSAVDQQVSVVLSCMVVGDKDNLPTEEQMLPETEVILDWLTNNYPLDQWLWYVQETVELRDPETDEVIAKGTPDLICLHRTRPVFACVDWKKRGQTFAGHLAAPDENLQQLTYVTAFWLKTCKERSIESAKIILAAWDETGVYPIESQDVTEAKLTVVVEQIRAIPPVDLDAPAPEASIGDHCNHCYQRMKCHAHLLPPAVVAKAGLPAPFAEFATEIMTADTAVKALGWLENAKQVLSSAKKIYELVEGNVDAFVTQNGPVVVGAMAYGPRPVNGKRQGATVKTLEAEGLQRLIRPGKDSTTCKWYKAERND
jgi:hypothetical protein